MSRPPRTLVKSRIVACSAFLLLAAFVASPAFAGSIVVINDKLERSEVASVTVEADTVSLVTSDGNSRQLPRQQVLRLTLNPVKAPEDTGMLRLTDDQQLAGTFAGSADDGQVLLWRHPSMGEVKVPLERVSAIRTVKASSEITLDAQAEALASDQITLVTGDTLTGFVEAFGKDHVALLLPDADVASPIPLARIARLRLANPAQATPTDASRVALTDGSVLMARRVTTATALSAQWTLRPDASVTVSMDRVAALDLSESGRRLVSLAELAAEVKQGGEVFGVSSPPTRVGDGWRLHAPVTVAFTLPEGASLMRIAATRDLEDVDQAERSWSDCIVIVRSADGKVLLEQRLHDEQPATQTVQKIGAGDAIEVVLDPGVNGPVLDRVRLTGEVLVDTTE